ncbi:alanine racemase [Robertkochia solimangrovi]|uniref:alanine racemase n=1 Tax=Robertkochia solimangrovi TaxID=2213046 RepID=UPI0011800EB5|nr:alanine racemase [Robertkochia solimangrovi]TRZ46136.1 alanine racemase [Robertkochia solimangrovi]
MNKARETVLEIDLGALEHNYKYLRSKLNSETRFLSVVKAYAYGSEVQGVAKRLEALGTDYFAVAYTSEGITLREAGITRPILVLHPLPAHFEDIIRYNLEPSLYNKYVLNEFIRSARKLHCSEYPVHIKINTGLNRLGFWENDTDLITEELEHAPELKIRSIFSHLAASEDKNEREFTLGQINSFKNTAARLIKKLGYKPLLHQLNTSGILNYTHEAEFDMVRSGIGLYGFGNEAKYDQELKPVVSLKSVISQIHDIEPGESVGYNRSFIADSYRRTATIPVGHADGITRIYGNRKGELSIHGKKAPIIGNVCMDMLMVDITDIPCSEGDEVIIFGESPTAAEFAERAGTISYELLTAISQRVKRVLINETTSP